MTYLVWRALTFDLQHDEKELGAYIEDSKTSNLVLRNQIYSRVNLIATSHRYE